MCTTGFVHVTLNSTGLLVILVEGLFKHREGEGVGVYDNRKLGQNRYR